MIINKPTPKIEYQVYPEDYFSGSDISIYFGDVWVDEVVTLSFALMEYVQPLFGFNSYTWDAVSRGARIVQGTFRINFREANYLNKILMAQAATQNDLEYWRRHPAERVSIDEFDNSILLYLNDPEGMREQLKYKTKEELAKIAAELEKRNYNPSITTKDNDPHFFKNYRKGFQKGFDIVVLYGSTTQFVAKKKEYEQRFLIPSAAGYKIKNIQLNGLSQDIAPDGTVIYENYSFIAQDLEPIK